MREAAEMGSHAVVGPDGRAMTLNDLPPPNTTRWVVRRKAQVVFGVQAGLISLEDALRRYNLTAEEYASWERSIERHGIRGLRVTRLKEYRQNGRMESRSG